MIDGFPLVEVTPLICDLIAKKSPVAIGVSGGKDSTVTAFETQSYLKAVGHTGPVILIHSDLGRIEHKDSLPACERLAAHLGLELIVVRRKAGDMMDRWLVRWNNNCVRYANLACVKLILPWSTASMRFCTSELKTAIICRDLVERFPGQIILNAVGIRRQESAVRAQAPLCSPQPKLASETFGTKGYNWHPILAWKLEDVLAYHGFHGFPLHEAYTKFGLSRVSCSFCILSSITDMIASATDSRNHDIYREMVGLEITSSFSFQSDRWLGDVAPHLLSEEMLAGLREAKRRAVLRAQLEARIPKHLLYAKGWPTVLPTYHEAVLVSEVRRSIADLMHFSIEYTEPDAILSRYTELMAINAARRNSTSTLVKMGPIQESLWDIERVS